ncbi:MAG: hypothetical protein IPQ26_06285 [Elusimicrobia bacterium]|nr:hypothetical protein [Elusimicrobiota bacterium]
MVALARSRGHVLGGGEVEADGNVEFGVEVFRRLDAVQGPIDADVSITMLSGWKRECSERLPPPLAAMPVMAYPIFVSSLFLQSVCYGAPVSTIIIRFSAAAFLPQLPEVFYTFIGRLTSARVDSFLN